MITPAQEKIARILRTDKDFIRKINERLSITTGRQHVFEKIVSENEKQIQERMLLLGVARNASAKEVYDALISKIEADDNVIFQALNRPACRSGKDCNTVLNVLKKATSVKKGFFLKKEKAAKLLVKEPPRKVLAYLGYSSAEAMLAKEDLFEIYSALRLIEDGDWLNKVFFKQYDNLTPADFESREIETRALSEKWNGVAEKFLKKKWHNISHLKEMGVIFVIPATLGISGELLRMTGLIFHYFHEIDFYSRMFEKLAAEGNNGFGGKIVSLLRGDVFDKRPPETEKTLWLVIQRYLAKDDENDWRLFAPHINPEALHWMKISGDLVKLGNSLDGFGVDFSFWSDLDWVGDYFKDEAGNQILVSFNLVDTAMSLVKEKELIKYLYHHQEALWNQIFISYFSQAELEEFSQKHLLRGWFEV